MAENTKIEWADHTASPWHGCSHAVLPDGTEHPGCLNCYAERMSKRNQAVLGSWGPDGTRVASQSFAENCRRWDKQAAKSGQRVIVFPSLDDPFEDFTGWVLDSNRAVQWHCRDCNIIETIGGVGHGNCCQVCGSGNGAPATMDDLRRDLLTLIDECPHLTFTLLTKRPQSVREMWPNRFTCEDCGSDQVHEESGTHCHDCGALSSTCYRENVWLLTSVSDQHTADQLIPPLLECRDLVPVLGLSIEPLLGSVDLEPYIMTYVPDGDAGFMRRPATRVLDWVIVGGESGPGARPMHPDWVRSLRDQCLAAGVPFFFKQWGEWAPYSDVGAPFSGADILGEKMAWVSVDGRWSTERTRPIDFGQGTILMSRVGKKAAGRLLDGVEWSEYPAAAVAAE